MLTRALRMHSFRNHTRQGDQHTGGSLKGFFRLQYVIPMEKRTASQSMLVPF
jgi:hypothetical protein